MSAVTRYARMIVDLMHGGLTYKEACQRTADVKPILWAADRIEAERLALDLFKTEQTVTTETE